MSKKGSNKVEKDLLAPIRAVHFIDRDDIKPNNYNPNKVTRRNLDLLKQSIIANGWTLPIVLRSDYTIIDGFHRWLVAGEAPLKEMLGNKIPAVFVEHDEESKNVYGTITHNRARGTHLLEPMKAIVQDLLKQGKNVKEIGTELGMRPEEVFRLSDFSKEDFLRMMAREKEYSKAEHITKW